MSDIKLESDDIRDIYNKLLQQDSVYQENREYVEGCNPTILRKQRKKDPDNRVPVPLAKSAVDDMTGYAGSDIKVTYGKADESVSDNALNEYQALMKSIQEYNKDHILTTELYKRALSHRKIYLLFWTTENLELENAMMTPEYSIVGMNEMYVKYDQKLKPEILYAIRFVKSEDKTITATVYFPLRAEIWIQTDKDEKWKKIDEEITYPYLSVPVAEFKIAASSGPLFQAEKPIIDKHDETISKAQNELDRFNALIALFPDQVTPEFVKKLEELKVIDDLGSYERWPEYLEKNLAGVTEYTNNHLDRLERLFHKTIKVVDFNNISVTGGDESGVARAFKLLGMEFKATEIEKYFNIGFEMRTKLINDVINASTKNIDTDNFRTIVTAKRNLPIDELNKLQIAQGLKMLGVREETILKVLPHTIIENVDDEVKSMKDAQQQESERFNQMLNQGE